MKCNVSLKKLIFRHQQGTNLYRHGKDYGNPFSLKVYHMFLDGGGRSSG